MFLPILLTLTFSYSSVVELTDKSYKHTLKENKKTIVMFYASWCGACRSMKPDYINISKAFVDGKVKFTMVNVDDNRELTKKHNIKSIPTTIVFKRDQEVSRHVGSLEKDEIINMLGYKIKKVNNEF